MSKKPCSHLTLNQQAFYAFMNRGTEDSEHCFGQNWKNTSQTLTNNSSLATKLISIVMLQDNLKTIAVNSIIGPIKNIAKFLKSNGIDYDGMEKRKRV